MFGRPFPHPMPVAAPGEAPGGCPSCEVLAKSFVRHVGLRWTCWQCGSELLPGDRGPKAPRRPQAIREMELIARFAPEIEGSAIPLNAPIYLEDPNASGTTGRTRLHGNSPNSGPQEASSMVADPLDALTVHVAGRDVRRVDDGRPDAIDENSADFATAVEALRRLDALTSTAEGSRHALVLLLVGYWLGPAARTHWENVTEDELVYGRDGVEEWQAEMAERFGAPANDGADAPEPLGLDWFVGMVCADETTRAFWLHGSWKLGRGCARMLGRQLIDAAVTAYETEPLRPRGEARHRDVLAHARDVLSAGVHGALEDVLVVARPRAHERRRKAAANYRKSAGREAA